MSYSIIKDGKSYTTKEWSNFLNKRHYKTPYKGTYGILKKSCKRRNLELNMTYKEFLNFTKIDTCHYCTKKVTWIKHGKVSSYNLDRKDNDLGYSLNNCVVCCWDCNNSRKNIFSYLTWYNMTSYLRNLRKSNTEKLYNYWNFED